MPGSSPRLANSLKQIRHKEKSLINAAFRPHLKQRRITRVENFGLIRLRFAFAIRDFLAILYSYAVLNLRQIRGIPRRTLEP